MDETSTANRWVQIHPDDNVVVSAQALAAGSELQLPGHDQRFVLKESIGLGHKLATRDILPGQPILKYGQPIGVARESIRPGDWVHVHNVRLLGEAAVGDVGHEVSGSPSSALSVDNVATSTAGARSAEPRTFEGYVRGDGKVGTRNYIAVISSVNCSASVCKAIARHFTAERLREFPQVDGVVAFTHHGGCAMQFAGQQHQLLNRVLGGIARHPNVGGYLLIGLGCEKATLDYLVDDQRLVQIEGLSHSAAPGRPPTLTMQSSGGTRRTIEAGIRHVESLLPLVNQARRRTVAAGHLVVGTQCGGSDGNSGVTANPALGVACDQVVAQGGTAILGETTEVVGAEHLLVRRAVDPTVGRKLLEKIQWWRWYAGIFGETIDDNRSAGNAAGGLTTIAEKSLGAIAKAGASPLVEVYEYAEPIRHSGLVMMDTPGFDPASITGMVAGGANLIVFTTGRGSCFGCKPSPSIKIATNTPMFRALQDDMDIDAGRILQGTSVAEMGREIFELMLRVASGEPTKSEAQGLGDEEFVPWMIGPVL